MPTWVNLKLNDPPGEIVPLPKVLPVTVWGAEVLLRQMTIAPLVIFSVCGLNANIPLLSVVIVTTTVGDEAGVGVGVGFDSVGVGPGLETVGVGFGLGGVGVKPGRDDVGVCPGGIDVGDSVDGVFVVPALVVLAIVGAGVAAALLLSPPHAVKTTNSASIKRLDQAKLLDKYMFFTIHTTSSRLV